MPAGVRLQRLLPGLPAKMQLDHRALVSWDPEGVFLRVYRDYVSAQWPICTQLDDRCAHHALGAYVRGILDTPTFER